MCDEEVRHATEEVPCGSTLTQLQENTLLVSLRCKRKCREKKKASEKAVETQFSTLEQMGCWELVRCPKNENVMHTRFVLKQKRDRTGAVGEHNGCLSICENEELDCQDKSLSPVAHYLGIKLASCIAIEQGRSTRNITLEIALPSNDIVRPVDNKMAARLSSIRKQ